MKITGFYPLIITKDADAAIAVFEALGFERSHRNADIVDREGIVSVRMKDEKGNHVDVVKSDKIERDQITVRINVDDFDEAYKIFEAHGFSSNTEKPGVMPSSKFIGMNAPSGFSVSLAQHIKKED